MFRAASVDIIIETGQDHVLAIEDTTNTQESSSQLQRYAEALDKQYAGRRVAAFS